MTLMRYIFVLLIMLMLFPYGAAARTFSIDKVRVEGSRRIERRVILAVLDASGGGLVDEKVIDRDLAEIFKLGKFSDVTAEVVTESGSSVLIYKVVERPLVRKLELIGNDEIKAEDLNELIQVKTPEIYNPKTVFESVKAMKAAYVEKGHYAATIETDLQVNDRNEATLSFNIYEGKQVLIDTIRFEGNTVFSDRELRKGIQTRERWIFSFLTDRGAYNEEMLQNDLAIVSDMYFNKGHVQVRVKQPDITIVEDGKYLDILIEVVEGDRFTVSTIDVQGELIAEKQTLMELNTLGTGAVFSREVLRESMMAINGYYADRGYAYVNVVPLTALDDVNKSISVKYDIEKGSKVYIGRIEIYGNTITVDKVIRREIALAEGDLFNASDINASRRRINSLGFFEEVSLNTNRGDDEQTIDIAVDVKGKPTGNFTLGLGYSSVDKLVVQGSIAQKNFLGRGLNMNASASLGGDSSTFRIGILDPYFLDSRISLGFDLYKTEREWDEYTEQKTGGDVKFGFPVAEDTRAFFIYRYEHRNITDVNPLSTILIKSQEGQSVLSSIFGSLTRDTTDYRPDPTMGGRSEGSLEYAGIGGTEKFARAIIGHRHFFPAIWGTVFTVNGQAGYLQEVAGQEIPISERFYMGGIRTIRGFKTREVGPRVRRTSEIIDPETGQVVSTVTDYEYIGGNKYAYFNVEYIFPLAREAGVKALLFFDTGNAWSEDEDFFSSMRYSAGAGVRWASPMGPLRFEWGYNLQPLEGEKQSVFEFSMGSFF